MRNLTANDIVLIGFMSLSTVAFVAMFFALF